MSDLADEARKAAVYQALKAKSSEGYELARAHCSELMDSGDRKRALIDDEHVADVIKTTGSRRAKVTDDATLLAWVQQNHPEEIVESIRPAYRTKLLDDAKHYGDAVDVTSGELVPGITVEHGPGHVSVRLADGALQVLAARWGEVLQQVPELGASDE